MAGLAWRRMYGKRIQVRRLVQSPAMQMFSYTEECPHPNYRKYGFTEYGKQKYRCYVCGKQFVDTWTISERRREFIETAVQLYRAGVTQTPAATVLGCCQQTVCNWYRRFSAYEERGRCGCGRPGGHSGWCWYRRFLRRSDRLA